MPRTESDDDEQPRRRSRGDEAGSPRRRPDRDNDGSAARRRPRRVAREIDEEEDRPRRKKSGKKGSNLPVILGVVAIAGLLFLSACGLGLYYLVSPTDSPKLGTTGPAQGSGGGGGTSQMPVVTLPAGWVEFNDPSKELRLYWPKGQPTRAAAAGAGAEMWTQEANGKKYSLVRSPLTPAEIAPVAVPNTLENAVAGMLSAMPGATEVRKNTEVEAGQRFRVSTIDIPQTRQRVFARLTVAKGKLIILTITAPMNNAFWATEPDTAPFFQSLWVR